MRHEDRNMESLASDLIALIALTAMEIVLGIDNIVFIAILSARLPRDQQKLGRRVGLLLAMLSRIALLLTLGYILRATSPIFTFSGLVGIPEGFFVSMKEINEISVRDMILFGGGLFLIAKSVHEIHVKLEGEEEHVHGRGRATLTSVVIQIGLLDIVFSFDSVITAVGMADHIYVMVIAVMIAVGIMIVFSEVVSRFVEENPTVKMLALSFLILIGVMLMAESMGTHFDKGYVYFAMAFALLVEFLNLRLRRKQPQATATSSQEAIA